MTVNRCSEGELQMATLVIHLTVAVLSLYGTAVKCRPQELPVEQPVKRTLTTSMGGLGRLYDRWMIYVYCRLSASSFLRYLGSEATSNNVVEMSVIRWHSLCILVIPPGASSHDSMMWRSPRNRFRSSELTGIGGEEPTCSPSYPQTWIWIGAWIQGGTPTTKRRFIHQLLMWRTPVCLWPGKYIIHVHRPTIFLLLLL